MISSEEWRRVEMTETGHEATICQSCGMPLQKEEDFGSNADGSRSGEYCHFCYKSGEFLDEGITMEKKIEKLVQMSVSQMNVDENDAREMANSLIPNLKRWRGS
jgi:hypothetical protein